MAGCATRLIFYLADVGLLTRRLLTKPLCIEPSKYTGNHQCLYNSSFHLGVPVGARGRFARENHEVGPGDLPAVFLLDRPQQPWRLVEVRLVRPAIERRSAADRLRRRRDRHRCGRCPPPCSLRSDSVLSRSSSQRRIAPSPHVALTLCFRPRACRRHRRPH